MALVWVSHDQPLPEFQKGGCLDMEKVCDFATLIRKKTVAVFCDQDGDMLEPMLLPQCFIFPSVEPLNSMIPLRPAGIDRNAAESCFLATQRGLKIGDVKLISHRWATDAYCTFMYNWRNWAVIICTWQIAIIRGNPLLTQYQKILLMEDIPYHLDV